MEDKNLTKNITIVPLSLGQVLFPGVVMRILGSDIGNLAGVLGKIYGNSKEETMIVGCVPVKLSSMYGTGKQKLLPVKEDIDGFGCSGVPVEALYNYGTKSRVVGVYGRDKSEVSIIVEGIERFRVEKIEISGNIMEGSVRRVKEPKVNGNDSALVTLFSELKKCSQELLAIIRLSALFRGKGTSAMTPLAAGRFELIVTKKGIDEAGALADLMAHIVEGDYEDKLRILSSLSLRERMKAAIKIVEKQIRVIRGEGNVISISSNLPIRIPEREQIHRHQTVIPFKMGDNTGLSKMKIRGFPQGILPSNKDNNDEIETLRKRLELANLPVEGQKVIERELDRLQNMSPGQAEYHVIWNYLDNLADIPWNKSTRDNLGEDVQKRAREIFEEDHYGLESVKKRFLEHLVVLRLKVLALDKMNSSEEKRKIENTERWQDQKRLVERSPILLLVGAPGTGKTSFARSIAKALERKFHRISLGGVRDEAEICGHRRTYVGAMPGVIVNGLKKVGVKNPVFLLDEIDKLTVSRIHGDPSAALLEALDPEQNYNFRDHYVNIPIDLSQVLFIATANSLSTIPPPLLDRMEVISLPGYTYFEKREIAKRHLLPKQCLSNGLSEKDVSIEMNVMDKIIQGYTRESGVRNLERQLGKLCRYKAVEYTDSLALKDTYKRNVTLDDVEKIFGAEKYEEEQPDRMLPPGVAIGLVAYSIEGLGGILTIEVNEMPGSEGKIRLTGTLGSVLKESIEVALSWVRANSYVLSLVDNPNTDLMKGKILHVHCPAGATPKDGPSAGITYAIALVSLFSGRCVPNDLAMTGEISLKGKVSRVGGIKQKLIGASCAGIKRVIIPESNKRDVNDVPREIVDKLEILCARHIYRVLQIVWPNCEWSAKVNGLMNDSKL